MLDSSRLGHFRTSRELDSLDSLPWFSSHGGKMPTSNPSFINPTSRQSFPPASFSKNFDADLCTDCSSWWGGGVGGVTSGTGQAWAVCFLPAMRLTGTLTDYRE